MFLLFAGFLVSAVPAFGVFYDDTQPDVTARVVRISFLSGDVQIRRVSEDGQVPEWEKATLNLPLVEGDEIATGPETLVEIQLDSSNHIRLAQNAYLKFTTLRDEGVAVSLPQGTMSFRSLSFDKGRAFFEIDAPNTTFSIERAGLYRIDAGDTKNSEITAVAAEDGEAKVYTQTSGFTLRSGKTAAIVIDGKYAGDYETNGISRSFDAFDQWVLDRDAVIAKRLSQAKFDRYYDRDIYGAEDLSEHGEWIYTRKYGYVWKPYANTISRYDNWSPYRYGHWRWLPFYGWTWVNDEPWGWATYHHGRWVWDSGYWAWTPYGQYRWRRSWWQPAIVRIGTWNGGTICWYPLGYDDYYYDYNRGYRRNRRNNVTIINNNTTIIVNPTPLPTVSPTPRVLTPEEINAARTRDSRTPTLQRIPLNAVIATNAEDFGKRVRGNNTLPAETAKKVLQTTDDNQSPPILPGFDNPKVRTPKEILVDNPRIDDRRQETVKTGASERQNGKSLNTQLEQERIFGNRAPKTAPEIRPQKDVSGGSTRDTGAVTRQPRVKTEDNTNNSPDFNPTRSNPTRNTDRKPPTVDQNPPVYNPPTRDTEERKPRQPPLMPPSEERRPETKPRPEPRRETPQPETRRSEPKQQPQPEPRRMEPKPQPQPKSEPKREEPKAPVDRKKTEN